MMADARPPGPDHRERVPWMLARERRRIRRFDWRNDRTGVELPHGQPDGEDSQVAAVGEEVLAAAGNARHTETASLKMWIGQASLRLRRGQKPDGFTNPVASFGFPGFAAGST